jgi:signal transduction histidine kinase
MTLRWRPPLFLVAVLLLGLIAVLATLQYRWVGQVSAAERDRVRASVTTGAAHFAQDFDRELTRAYLLFQSDPMAAPDEQHSATAFGLRYDRWLATAQFPRLIKDCYVFSRDSAGAPRLERFDPASRQLRPAEWPASMADWRTHLQDESSESSDDGRMVFIRRIAPPIWQQVPAVVVPLATVVLSDLTDGRRTTPPALGYTVLTLDTDYIARELLPTLAERHFSSAATMGAGFQVAVVSREAEPRVIYRSTPQFAPAKDEAADASADLFQVRTSDFTTLAAEVKRFTAFTATVSAGAAPPPLAGRMALHDGRPVSILVQSGPAPDATARRGGQASARFASATEPIWRVVLKHPAGSLERAVGAARRRNLILSSSILAVLGASMGLLVLSTRRAQRLARQQMEFVAAVSHELRTPLAVIRSAAENLADGVVHDDDQIRKYGDLMRTEGRRLTEMVEQILELAGIQSGQRGFALRPVQLDALVRDIVSSSSTLLDEAGIAVEFDLAPDLPAVLGDEEALRRAFQNVVANAIKYGRRGRWIGIRGRRIGPEVEIAIADRGIGIAAVEQARIFDPFYRASEVVSAQIQGAGLGLSLVRRIVEAHGGGVGVTSTHGSGSEFTVHLRAAAPAASREAGADAPIAGFQSPRSL